LTEFTSQTNPFHPKLTYCYDLKAVIMHRGTLDSGHYTCAAKLEQKWIKLDDDKVTEMQPSTVESNKEAYLLFYEQK
jgi:ubiquitin C-terminal hydrolase